MPGQIIPPELLGSLKKNVFFLVKAMITWIEMPELPRIGHMTTLQYKLIYVIKFYFWKHGSYFEIALINNNNNFKKA